MNLIENFFIANSYSNCPEGLNYLIISEIAVSKKLVFYILENDLKLQIAKKAINLINSKINLLILPAWDCIPYDRLSPHRDIISKRI